MPSLQDIRQFNHRLTTMGSEPEVVREWGEELEDVPVPEAGLDEDLSSLLSDSGEEGPGDAASDDVGPPDFDDLLGESDTEEVPPGLPAGEWGPESFEAPEPGEDAMAASAEAAEGAGGDFDFGGDLDALFGDLSDDDTEPSPLEEPEGAGEPEPDERAAEPGSPIEEGDFSDFEALLGGEDAGGAPDPEADPSADLAAPDEFTAPDEFDLADDIDFDEPADEALDFGTDFDASAPDSGVGDAGDFDEGGPPADEFALPEGGFSLDDEEPTGEIPGGEEPADDFDTDFGDFGGFEISDEEPGAGPGPEEITADGEDFSFEQPVVPGAEGEFEDVGELDEVGEDDLDEFSLGDFGAEFGVIEEGPSDEELNPAINIPSGAVGAPEAPAAGAGQFQLTEDEFSRLRATLSTLPLNLKQGVEEVIGEAKGTTDDVEKLCRMLVDGESAQDIATYTGRILGTKIRIPRGYEKRSGEAFEAERQSLAYQFRENVWPIIRLATVFLVVVGLLGLLAYNFVFRPLLARSLYVEGIELIEADQYTLANQTFDRAWEIWPNSERYYDYADAFIDERQYTLAQEKYEELLFGRDPRVRELANEALAERNYAPVVANHPLPRRGVLAYAELESETLGNYERADRLINLVLYSDVNDYEGRLALGDNSMRWAEEEPQRFEDARLAYARLIERFGQTDELLFRMMRYFIATDNLDEVITLKEAFQGDPRAEINPEIYAELAGYLIDNDLLADVEDVAFRALDVDRTIPELHYHLARYYRRVSAPGEEDLSLATARRLLEEAEPLSASRMAMLVDTHTRIGENRYAAGNFLDAQESFTTAISVYERGRARRMLGPDSRLARAHARLGDVFFYVGREYELALSQYDRAEANGYASPDLDYRQGFVHYRNDRVDVALEEFRSAARDPSAQTNALLWATANTHFRRGYLFAAEAYFRELLDRVERERESIRSLLVDEDPRHRSVIEYLFRGYNNLGVVLHDLSEQTADPEKYSQSLVYFTRSTELAENYGRDPSTLVRTDAVDLAFLNQREALFPRPEFEMQIYNDIPEDLDDLLF